MSDPDSPLAPAVSAPPPTPLGEAALAAAAAYARLSLAPATRRAYQADWREFVAWCAEAGLPPLPAAPATVAAHLAAMAKTHARASLRRPLAAFGQMQRLQGPEWESAQPAIPPTPPGLLRQHGAPARRAAA